MALALAAFVVFGVAAGIVAGPTRARRWASLLFVLCGVATPFLVSHEHTVLRATLALGGVLLVLRGIDLARSNVEYPLALRVALMFSVLDLRRVAPMPPVVELRRLGIALGCAALSAAGYALGLSLSPAGGAITLRWLGGAVGIYCLAEVANQLTLFAAHAAGHRIPPQHRAPVLATSVSEFWSRRWNLNVRDWLFRHCHRPLAAAGRPQLGVAWAFAASALLHFWLVLVPLGLGWALVMASFFLLQGLFVLAEARLGAPPSLGRRVWTIAAVAGASPLFVEPMLRIFE